MADRVIVIPTFREATEHVANKCDTPLDRYVINREPFGPRHKDLFRTELQALVDYLVTPGGVSQ